MNPRNHRGETILSINHALEEMDWRNAEEIRQIQSKSTMRTIGGYNKGGLIVRFGRLRGFVPQSQLSEDRIGDRCPAQRLKNATDRWSIQPIGVKVMEVDRHRNRLILSERAAIRDVRQRAQGSLDR